MQGACNVGIFMLAGIGCPKNEHEAVKYFRIAAQKQHAGACYTLGQIYESEGRFKEAMTMYDCPIAAATLLSLQKSSPQCGHLYRRAASTIGLAW